jgi:hypothetical protein
VPSGGVGAGQEVWVRRFVASVSAVTLAAVLGACGGGTSKASPPTTSDNGATSPSSSDTDLSSLVANANRQKFKITFTLGNSAPQVYEQDGNGNSVLAGSDSQTFTTKTDTITCDKSSGTYQCDKSPGTDGSDNPFLGVVTLEETQLTALGGRFGATAIKTIAGRRARCVTFAASDLIQNGDETTTSGPVTVKGSYSYCIDAATGATLQVSTTDSAGRQSSVLLVTKFESPRPSDFTPPSTPG